MVMAFALGLDRISARRVVGLAVAFTGVAIVVALGSGSDLSFDEREGAADRPRRAARVRALQRHPEAAARAVRPARADGGDEPRRHASGLTPFVRGSTVDTVVDATAAEAALLLYLGVLATLLGYIFWNAGLKGLGPTRAVTYAYAIPPLAVTFGAIFLDEPVTIWLAVGGALVVGGIALAQRPAGSVAARFAPWRRAPSEPSRSVS